MSLSAVTRCLAPLALALALAACATPQGSPLPKPTDYTELSRVEEIFKRWSVKLAQDPDVTAVFLSSNNNPRRIIVQVKDRAAHDRLLAKYGGTIEGIDTWYPIDFEADSRDPIVAVPKVEEPTTWWGKVMAAFMAWRTRITATVAPAPSASPANAPPVPTGSVRQI